jgi:hypothetical protein
MRYFLHLSLIVTIMLTGILICQRLDGILLELKKPKKIEMYFKQQPRKIIPKKRLTPV